MKMCEQQYNLNRKMDVTVECVRRIGSTNQAEVVNMLLSMVSQFTTYREIRCNLFCFVGLLLEIELNLSYVIQA